MRHFILASTFLMSCTNTGPKFNSTNKSDVNSADSTQSGTIGTPAAQGTVTAPADKNDTGTNSTISEKITPPQPFSGAYLFCANLTQSSTVSYNAESINGCRLEGANKIRIRGGNFTIKFDGSSTANLRMEPAKFNDQTYDVILYITGVDQAGAVKALANASVDIKLNNQTLYASKGISLEAPVVEGAPWKTKTIGKKYGFQNSTGLLWLPYTNTQSISHYDAAIFCANQPSPDGSSAMRLPTASELNLAVQENISSIGGVNELMISNDFGGYISDTIVKVNGADLVVLVDLLKNTPVTPKPPLENNGSVTCVY